MVLLVDQLLAVAKHFGQLHKFAAQELSDVGGAVGLSEAELNKHVRISIALDWQIGGQLELVGVVLLDDQLVLRFIRYVG